MIVDINTIIQVVIGASSAFLTEKFKGVKFFENPTVQVLVTGIVGLIGASIVNFLIPTLGLGEAVPIQQIVLMAFGITPAAATVTYHTLIKEEKK